MYIFADRGTKFCSRWGLALTRAEDETSVFILDTPTCVERLEPSTQVDLCQSILQEICRTILDKSVLPNLPDTVMALLASQACRGAIMFGESLAKDKCQELLTDLAKCKAPFQCAHGRPAVTVLGDLEEARNVDQWGVGTIDLNKLTRYL